MIVLYTSAPFYPWESDNMTEEEFKEEINKKEFRIKWYSGINQFDTLYWELVNSTEPNLEDEADELTELQRQIEDLINRIAEKIGA